MMKTAAFGFTLILVSCSAYGADQQALANAKGCLACHTVDAKKIGPSYKSVAAKYAGQSDAGDKLVKKVLEGGSGNWGSVPMPPNKTMGLKEADARKLVTWILELK
jgi:cytochrome c